MKRMLLVLLALICVATCSFAEEIDLQSLTDDELISLYDALKDEFTERFGGEGEHIYSGVYVVGKEICSGAYRLTLVTDGGSRVYVWPSEEMRLSNPSMREFVKAGGIKDVVWGGESINLFLKDGMTLELEHSADFLITPISASWLPDADNETDQ